MFRIGIIRAGQLKQVSLSVLSRFEIAVPLTNREYHHHNRNHRMPSTTKSEPRDHACLPAVLTISVDGNISSGKSTLVSNLQKLFPNDFNFHVQLIPEPLEKWTNLNGENLLEMFYKDPVKHNFMFQSYVQLTRLIETIKRPEPEVPDSNGDADRDGNLTDTVDKQKTTVRIMERSLQNNRYCFAELARQDGRLQPAEFAVLSEWYNWMGKHFDLNLDLIIYLRTSPETVFNRMKNRGRAEESSVPMDYLEKLHDAYEDWLVNKPVASETLSPSKVSKIPKCKDGMENQKIIVIDADQGKEEVAAECQRRIRAFISEMGFLMKSGSPSQTKSSEPNSNFNQENEIPKKIARRELEFVENNQKKFLP